MAPLFSWFIYNLINCAKSELSFEVTPIYQPLLNTSPKSFLNLWLLILKFLITIIIGDLVHFFKTLWTLKFLHLLCQQNCVVK